MNAIYDLLVIGGGNAALCAVLEAVDHGVERILILEAAPQSLRGGNSRHTRNIRCMHLDPLSILPDRYDEQEYFQDLIRVTGAKTDETLARIAIERSAECLPWMRRHGVHFQPPLSGSLSLERTNAFFLGGGKALLNAYYVYAQDRNVAVLYNARVTALEIVDARFQAALVEIDGRERRIEAQACILASGGFQGNREWLRRAWGAAASNFLIRGTPYNRGDVLQAMIDQGALVVGDPTQCHAVAIDGRSPLYDGGIVTRLDCVPFSVVVNKNCDRFYDEGEDVWPKRYAIWGRLVAEQPDQIAYVVIDSRSIDLFMPSVFPPIQAQTLNELATLLTLDPQRFSHTIQTFNQACPQDESRFRPTELDDLAALSITPPKTNWARSISVPPFYAYPLRPGITFTYLGLKVDPFARVQRHDRPYENLWAAGEIMAGSILGQGYLAGFGMTIGTVFGRTAGQQAAHYLISYASVHS